MIKAVNIKANPTISRKTQAKLPPAAAPKGGGPSASKAPNSGSYKTAPGPTNKVAAVGIKGSKKVK